MRTLEYPFDPNEIIKKKNSIKKALLNDESRTFLDKKIAVLGGETTRNIIQTLELFLLDQGIKPSFYESEYNKYYEDGMFPNKELEEFSPDIIYVCTCLRNITAFPEVIDDKDTVLGKLNREYVRFESLWEQLSQKYDCPIIQNNFEYPSYRLLGNKDVSDFHGRVNYVIELNRMFSGYAQKHSGFFICDVNYLSASYGLERWSDPYYWNMYKYAVSVPAIPYLSFNVSNIIKSIFGKNKKVLNLDLDNTLWGGVIGDDGADNIEIGQETALAQAYSEFQAYIKQHEQIGVLLTVNSKNDEKVAWTGFERPDSVLHLDDFVSFKANWNPKPENLYESAKELSLLPESFVFVDDNPAEREIIRRQAAGVAVPEIDVVEKYIETIDKSGFFEVTYLSSDDLSRNKMYVENAKRHEFETGFESYYDYLRSLEMKGEIAPFIPMYMSRIAQLTNKSNQFNLTTRRYSQSEIEDASADPDRITLYGKLKDRFGDNGVVSIVIGHIDGPQKDELHMELWLMSCRVLKRNMEYAMMDELVKRAKERGIKRIIGYYYPTAKNAMVKDFYALQGFKKINEDEGGNTTWEFEIKDDYVAKQDIIEVESSEIS